MSDFSAYTSLLEVDLLYALYMHQSMNFRDLVYEEVMAKIKVTCIYDVLGISRLIKVSGTLV